jgi:hypothetical protein
VHLLVQRALSDDDQDANDAIRELWHLAPQLAEGFDGQATSDDELIDQATQLLTYWTNQGLKGVEMGLAPSAHWGGRVGDFALTAYAPTLLGMAYHQLALTLNQRVPLRSCVECGRYFEVKDKRQRFCSSTCSGRARQRRFMERKEQKS